MSAPGTPEGGPGPVRDAGAVRDLGPVRDAGAGLGRDPGGDPAGAQRRSRAARARQWRLPQASLRFVPVFRRHLLVSRKLALASTMANILDPLIVLLAFGYGLGRLLPNIDGVPYIVFLAAGAVCANSAMVASFESLYSAFSRMHIQRTWESIVNAPVDLDDVLIAEWLWSGAKCLFAGTCIVAVVAATGISRAPTLALLLPLATLTGLAIAAIALCFTALARGYDFFTYYFTLFLTPMVFLSGVYYPVDQLPGWLASASRVLPLSAAVELARPLVLGRLPAEPWPALALLAAYALGFFQLAVVLARRRFAL